MADLRRRWTGRAEGKSVPLRNENMTIPLADTFFHVASDTGGVAVDGTSPLNQVTLSATNQSIGAWSPGGALWLVWRMTDSTGKSQGLGIDNLSFSAGVDFPPAPLTVQVSGTNLLFTWPGESGATYQLEYKDQLDAPNWTTLGSPVPGNGATLSLTNDSGNSPQRFFRLRMTN